MGPLQLIFLSAAGFFIICENNALACNEAVCASVVSKCMLTQSCKCDLKSCSCCQECFSCLSWLFDECCSCLDMCPQRTENISLGGPSHVEKFAEPNPDLFNALTEVEDHQNRWQSYTLGNGIDSEKYPFKHERGYKLINNEQEVDPQKSTNCTVAYLTSQMSWKKCRQTCQSMGASKYRWFHNGCCECIGSTCIGFGSDENSCPLPEEAEDENVDLQYDDGAEYSDAKSF